MEKKADVFGIGALILAYLSFIILIILFVSPIPYKSHTLFGVIYLTIPSLIATPLYIKLSKANYWPDD